MRKGIAAERTLGSPKNVNIGQQSTHSAHALSTIAPLEKHRSGNAALSAKRFAAPTIEAGLPILGGCHRLHIIHLLL
ncbi:MAG: hypothetical protein VYD85_02055 [Pseudomonadota bacterium]|nr:hypothetical protein [Pseudomonadota bacterium]